MRKYPSLLAAAVVVGIAALSYAQVAIEVKKPTHSSAYIDVKQRLEALGDSDRSQAIELLTTALPGIVSPFERFELIFWELSFHYASNGQYQGCHDVLKQGQQEGLFYPLQVGERTWPEYLKVLDSLKSFDAFIERNSQLLEDAQKEAQFEYIVQLPASYREARKYPLLVVLHGGFGSHLKSAEDWRSPGLDSEFVVTFVQGTAFRGSFLRSYLRDDLERIAVAYHQVTQKYSIDTSRVILAGPSAGGARAIMLAQDKIIPAAGLILAFPVKPLSLDEQKLDSLAAYGTRAAFLCGEKDWAIKQQKEMGYLFDKHYIPNRFIVASGYGHEFPPDFSEQIDRSLDFIFQNE